MPQIINFLSILVANTILPLVVVYFLFVPRVIRWYQVLYKERFDKLEETQSRLKRQAQTNVENAEFTNALLNEFLRFGSGAQSLKKRHAASITRLAQLQSQLLKANRERDEARHKLSNLPAPEVKPPALQEQAPSLTPLQVILPHRKETPHTESEDERSLKEEVAGLRQDNKFLREKNTGLVALLKQRQGTPDSLSSPYVEEAALPRDGPGEVTGAKSFPVEGETNNDVSVDWKLNGVLVAVRLPETFSELKEWVEEFLPGKLALSSKSVPKESDVRGYKNVALVYKALLLLGTRWDMLYGGGLEHKKYFDEKLAELHLRCSTAITQKGKIDEFYVVVDGERVLTNLAIKYSNTRDPDRLMRVYFFDDKPHRRIIVGHLPFHLPSGAR